MTEAYAVVENLLDQEPLDDNDPKEMASDMKSDEDDKIAAARASGVVNPSTVRQGEYIWHRTAKKADGRACGARVTSIKTWKTRPDDFEIGWKYGMYDYGKVGPHNAEQWTTIEPAPVPKIKKEAMIHSAELVAALLEAGEDDFDAKAEFQRMAKHPDFGKVDIRSLSPFVLSYLEAVLFASTDSNDEPLDKKHSIKNFSNEFLEKAVVDCEAFQAQNQEDLAHGSDQQGGHDFWLTRVGTGAGFWDGDWPEDVGERLTTSANRFGGVDVYTSRGKIYCC